MTFDYIIIGAGSAGCVLAHRLSANPAHRVLLLEAGGKDHHPFIHLPGGYLKLHHSAVDWNCYYTEPQLHLNHRKIYHPRGKVLGGSSSTNAMAYVRGQREDYDGWAQQGCEGWDYEQVLPYFLKSEHNEQFNDSFHQQGGLLNVTHAYWWRTPLGEAFIQACAERGIATNADINGADQRGAGWLQYTMKNAQRHSAARAFLVPALQRKNLTVATRAVCQQLLIKNDVAVGAAVSVRGGATQVFYASREVILCAGAFESPKLLMLSGIGEAQHLQACGIDVKKDLPGVGKNLHDHLFFPVGSLCKVPVSNNGFFPLHQQALQLVRYLITRSGPLSIGPLEAVAFFSSESFGKRPDLQFQFTPTNAGEDDRHASMYDMKSFPRSHGYTILPTQVRPLSRGEVRLASAQAGQPPVIDPRYLSHETDRQLLIAGGKKALEVLEADAFAPYRLRNHIPRVTASDDDWLQHISELAECVYHPVGTCKMGRDSTSVVDPQLRVHGIDRLRVADASVMPQISSGNTNAPTMMIAERAADFIVG